MRARAPRSLCGALRHDKLQIAAPAEADAERQSGSGNNVKCHRNRWTERQRMKDGKKKADCAIFASSHQARSQARVRERERGAERGARGESAAGPA